MKIQDFIPPVFLNLYRRLRLMGAKKNQTIHYRIGDIEVGLPSGHDLPKFQRMWKLYDRFLPLLSKYISSTEIVVDVGANVGDTAVAILQNCKNPMICIEPSEVFYPYLTENLKTFVPNRVTFSKSLVGTGNLSGALEHTQGGTAKIVEGESDPNKFTSLDLILEGSNAIQLIKVDTDGYDFDVLLSAENSIAKWKPILFWENVSFERFQMAGYERLYYMLTNLGYNHIWIFDNFGNLVSEESDFRVLKNLNTYIHSMEKFQATRTLYYTDILACTDKYLDQVELAIKNYKTELINH